MRGHQLVVWGSEGECSRQRNSHCKGTERCVPAVFRSSQEVGVVREEWAGGRGTVPSMGKKQGWFERSREEVAEL